MLLVAGVYGVFVSLDLFQLIFFYELSIFPMYILIATWGSTRKEYAAMKLTLYLLIGSIIALIGILAVYFSAQIPPDLLPAGLRTPSICCCCKRPTSRSTCSASGSCRSSSASACWPASGRSTTGRLMVTWRPPRPSR